jgi:hypothetical protein
MKPLPWEWVVLGMGLFGLGCSSGADALEGEDSSAVESELVAKDVASGLGAWAQMYSSGPTAQRLVVSVTGLARDEYVVQDSISVRWNRCAQASAEPWVRCVEEQPVEAPWEVNAPSRDGRITFQPGSRSAWAVRMNPESADPARAREWYALNAAFEPMTFSVQVKSPLSVRQCEVTVSTRSEVNIVLPRRIAGSVGVDPNPQWISMNLYGANQNSVPGRSSVGYQLSATVDAAAVGGWSTLRDASLKLGNLTLAGSGCGPGLCFGTPAADSTLEPVSDVEALFSFFQRGGSVEMATVDPNLTYAADFGQAKFFVNGLHITCTSTR